MLRAASDRGRQAKERLTGEVRARIRERAIKKAKVRIALHWRKRPKAGPVAWQAKRLR